MQLTFYNSYTAKAADWGERMISASNLTETITKKQELVEKEEELEREAIENSINSTLKRYFEVTPNDKFLEALRENRYLHVCLKMPRFENRHTRIGKMYMESVNKILQQQNDMNLDYLLEIETDKRIINRIERSKRNKDCIGHGFNSVIIRIFGKQSMEKPTRIMQ